MFPGQLFIFCYSKYNYTTNIITIVEHQPSVCGQGSTCGHDDRDAKCDAPSPRLARAVVSSTTRSTKFLSETRIFGELYGYIFGKEDEDKDDDEEEKVCTKTVTTQWLANICIDNIPIVISSYVLDDFVDFFENIRRRAKENVI